MIKRKREDRLIRILRKHVEKIQYIKFKVENISFDPKWFHNIMRFSLCVISTKERLRRKEIHDKYGWGEKEKRMREKRKLYEAKN